MANGSNTKEDILNASKDLFYLNGYNKTTFRQIASEVNMFHPNIVYYFKNKTEILKCLFLEYFKKLIEIILKSNKEMTDIELLMCYIYVNLDFMQKDKNFKHLYFEATDVIIEVLYDLSVRYLFPRIDKSHEENSETKRQNIYMMDLIVLVSAEKQLVKYQENKLLNVPSEDIYDYMTKLNLKLLDIDLESFMASKKMADDIIEKIDLNELNIFRKDYKIILS